MSDYGTSDWYDDSSDTGYQPGATWTDSSGTTYTYDGSSWQRDNDSDGSTPGANTNVDTTTPGGASGAGLEAGVRKPIEGGGFQTLNKDGSITYEDPDGQVYTVNPNGTYTGDSAGSSWTYDPKTGKFADTGSGVGSLINSVKQFFKKPDGSYDWGKIAGFGAAAYGMMGGDKRTAGGWQGSIPKYTATRQEIQYDDTNRRPGAQGRKYFTDVQYGAEGAAPAAKAAAEAQAQGILANYKPAEAPVNKWDAGSVTPAVATPWANKTAPVIKAATGRYLQGPTDGMADKINTSIDGRQPAKLSHGEFVVPADVVSHLGNGNSDAGAKKLYSMMDRVRQARTGTKKQGKQINPDKYMPGGTVNNYAKGGIAELPVKKFVGGGSTYGPASDTTTSSTLSPWAGDYVADYLGRGQALANAPYQAYKGPLTAGPSALEQQAFTGASNLASTGLAPTEYTGGTWNTEEANKYMNPYLKAALDPQMEELRRQSQINLQSQLGSLGKAGGYGGGRQAIMQSEAMRNLLQEQNKTVGQGYATAYDKAMDAYNKGRTQTLDVEKAQQAANEASANFGLKSLQELEKAGQTQREIEQAGLTADKAQFEEQRDYPYKMVQYQQGLLQGLPITTQSNTQNMSGLTSLLANAGFAGKLQELINQYVGSAPGATATKSPGAT
jgi:hypothetical protein